MFEIIEDKIKFFDYYNEPISDDLFDIIKTKKKVTFGSCFNQPLPDLRETKIEKIIFRGSFNQSIGKLPKDLTYLNLGENYNMPINELPGFLETLILSCRYNHPLMKDGRTILPRGLRVLKMGMDYNYPIGRLPDSIEYLFISDCFNHVMENMPENIKIVKISPFNPYKEKYKKYLRG